MKTARMTLLVPMLMFASASFADDSRTSETREVSDFHSVAVGQGLKAQVKVGPKSVRLEGPADKLSKLRLVVKDGQLTTEMDRGNFFKGMQNGRVTLYISSPRVEGVSASGGSHVEAEASASEDFSAEASGGAALTIRDINSDKLDIEASGGSVVNLSGRARDMEVEASGGTIIKAMDVKGVKRLEVEASGGSQLEADPSEKLSVEASGGSTIQCATRPPRTEVKANGGSRVVYTKD
ncbi:DUF2807 domain-containing protein [Myxococcus stipitatus]|uniref:head GIN domain-containing protein n=1 Tax=Myxococcus stipitatus TaxID=83455 RepID=UPI0031452860